MIAVLLQSTKKLPICRIACDLWALIHVQKKILSLGMHENNGGKSKDIWPQLTKSGQLQIEADSALNIEFHKILLL